MYVKIYKYGNSTNFLGLYSINFTKSESLLVEILCRTGLLNCKAAAHQGISKHDACDTKRGEYETWKMFCCAQ
jgi:hypothetical protein